MVVSYMDLIRTLVSQLRETQALACGGCGGGGCGGGCGGGGGGGGVQTKTIISPKYPYFILCLCVGECDI